MRSVDPRMRGVILLDRFHVPRSLRKVIRRGTFEVSYDREFEAVIEACAEATQERPRTWINDKIIELYATLHRMGHAHSVECRVEGQLVGGLYGVSLGGVFFGESMFSRVTDASKVALVYLVASLKLGGYQFVDTQFITRHLARFGTIELPRNEYRKLLSHSLGTRAQFVTDPDPQYIEHVMSL
jgi:leucyl/phenylalanyl-tRNA--protein transferase